MGIAFGSPVGKRIYPLQYPTRSRTLNDPNTFEVTQRFATPDSYWSNTDPSRAAQIHGAVDIGNGFCGEPILAMASGVAWNVSDNATQFGAATNALGVVVDHGGGLTTEIWHLDRWALGAGRIGVTKGQVIGYLGRTGLGNVCHAHIELKVNGSKIDPEPYIFGATYGEIDPVGDEMQSLVFQPSRVTLKAGTNVRVAPNTDPAAYAFQLTATQNRTVYAYGTVVGVPPWEGADPHWGVYWDKANSRNLYYHSSRVESGEAIPFPAPPPPPAADCTQAVAEATVQLQRDLASSQARISAAKAALG